MISANHTSRVRKRDAPRWINDQAPAAKGGRNQKTLERMKIAEQAKAGGITPLELMLQLMRTCGMRAPSVQDSGGKARSRGRGLRASAAYRDRHDVRSAGRAHRPRPGQGGKSETWIEDYMQPIAGRDRAVIDVWTAQDRQRALIACPMFEVFFGGARGGGKTDGVLGDWLEHAATYGKNATGLMLRRQRTELVETIERRAQIYGPLGWKYSEQKSMWTSRTGARLRFGYLERDADADVYHGHSYTRLYVEEITNFPSDKPIMKLMATLRSAHGVPVGFRCTGNPGGPGHHWVKARYVTPAPLGGKIITDEKSGLQRVYIMSRVADNKYLGPGLCAAHQSIRRRSTGTRLAARRLGVIEGAFFTEFNADCIIRPFTIPKDWRRFRIMDWGFATPFSVNWWAIPTDPMQHDGRTLPRGALICYREWYGRNGEPNIGLRLTAEEVAAGIKRRELGDGVRYGVLDPSRLRTSRRPQHRRTHGRAGRMVPTRRQPTRTGRGHAGGWDQMRQRLKAGQLFFFSPAPRRSGPSPRASMIRIVRKTSTRNARITPPIACDMPA